MHKALSQKMSELTGVAEKQGDIGVELEIEGENLPTEIVGWDIHPETSLRGRNGRTVAREESQVDTPREYVTARPVLYRNLLPKLRTLNSALTARGVAVELTQRASTHIHLNMGPETLQTFIAFVLSFVTIEPLLLRLCGPLRNGNLFCLPSYETGELAFTLRGLSKRLMKNNSLIHNWPSRGKYACLNLDPMHTQGSIEVRCFPNAIDPELVNSWAQWLVTIRDNARTLNVNDALDRWYDRPSTVADAVFGYDTRELLAREAAPQSPGQLVQFGVENAYEIWRAIHPLYTEVDTEPEAEIDVVGVEPSVGVPRGLFTDPTIPRDQWGEN
jgi:hypothetical protein